jgi:hypothetical protein
MAEASVVTIRQELEKLLAEKSSVNVHFSRGGGARLAMRTREGWTRVFVADLGRT